LVAQDYKLVGHLGRSDYSLWVKLVVPCLLEAYLQVLMGGTLGHFLLEDHHQNLGVALEVVNY
jgi:hypothetical protein